MSSAHSANSPPHTAKPRAWISRIHQALVTVALTVLAAIAPATEAQAAEPPPDLSPYIEACTNAYRSQQLPACVVMQTKADSPNSGSNNYCFGLNNSQNICLGVPGVFYQVSPAGSPYGWYVYAWAFIPDDKIISLEGPGSTKALPAGPILRLTARVKVNGRGLPNHAIRISMAGRSGIMDARTDNEGKYEFDYVPPRLKKTTDRYSA